jgi:NADH-quinone oxidoreductase subunit G
MNVLGFANRGAHEVPATSGEAPLNMTQCIECGQCASICPVGAIVERPAVREVMELLAQPKKKIMIAQTAPAVRVAISEEMNMGTGTTSAGQMVAGLRAAGFDYVFDTDFTADLTIMEEGTELLTRVEKGGPFPMFTSCCPGWISFVEKLYPEFMPNLSTCKSPQQMMGALIKAYYTKKLNVKASDVCVVSIMPCTAKKFEATRPEFAPKGVPDVDYVLTTRELGQLFRLKSIPLGSLTPLEYDNPLGLSTGAAVIFGSTGGVMEAAVRTAYEISVGKPLPKLDLVDFRGFKGIKHTEAVIKNKAGQDVNVKLAVANGIANARALLEEIKAGKAFYHFIEVMTCPSGCIGGGGQPKSLDPEILKKRFDAIYTLDERSTLRKSHENPAVLQLYKEYLEKPNSHISHELLHTHYHERPVGKEEQKH